MCNSVLNALLLVECTPVFLILYLNEINSDKIYMFLFAQNALCCNKRQRIIAVKISETRCTEFSQLSRPRQQFYTAEVKQPHFCIFEVLHS